MYKSIKIKNYKCFVADNDYQGFDDIKPINIIIGKNNSGKSKLLEALRYIISEKNEKIPFDVRFVKPLEKEEVGIAFGRNVHTSGLGRLGTNYSVSDWDGVGKYLVNRLATYEIRDKLLKFTDIKLPQDLNAVISIDSSILNRLSSVPMNSPFSGYKFLHLQAERDIGKESLNYNFTFNNPVINSNASGITSLIARMLNDESENENHWQEYIENDFLSIINKVVSPEIEFTRIFTKTNKSFTYEIYLEEKNKGGLKLSDCGSGLKTIIATLTLLHIIPHVTKNKKLVIALEELENNMHPSLERKLLSHIKNYSKENLEVLIFLTTHSNVAIDLFGSYSNAQIVKVCNDGYKSTVEAVITDDAKRALLDELGVKASDLLQANCAIWVEGPSDRIYIKKWLELYNDGETLEEGLHYQFVYYGGSLLSHYSTKDDGFINLLKINKNSYVVMDSDKRNKSSQLKDRVKKIKNELPAAYWITKGKEIENYLPEEALTSYFGKKIAFGQFDLFPDIYKVNKKITSFDKVGFASKIVQDSTYTKENLSKCMDLESKTKELINFIRKSNLSPC